MPDPRSPGLAATVMILILVAGLAAVVANVWPAWAGCLVLAVFFGSAWWIGPRQSRTDLGAAPPDPPGAAERKARDDARRTAEWRAEQAEHERVEAALVAILKRDGVRYRYQRPMGGHMDKRDGTYVLAEPLPLTARDVAALTGPLTRVDLDERDGQILLTSLDAHDRFYGGIEVVVERATP